MVVSVNEGLPRTNRAPMLNGMKSAIKLVDIAEGTAVRTSKTRRDKACLTLLSLKASN